MKESTVADAVNEAHKFIKRAELWLARKNPGWSVSREGGDLRRQSMELTRALTKMRKP